MDSELVKRPLESKVEGDDTSLLTPTRVREDRSNSEDGEAAATSPPSSSLPAVREDGFQYDVFLSFRGADTRKGFTGHLYQALKDKGIFTFIDSEALERGQKVEELFGHIERSKIFVPIFSKGYADSKWCLEEIDKIVKCKRLIIPVFFDVDPRDVRHQTGSFGRAFRSYHKDGKIDEKEVSNWRDALRGAGGISGYNLADTEGDEAKLIRLIVKRILTEVNKTSLFVANHPVGLDSRIADVLEVLEVEAHDEVKMVGIHGMGGIGKTTVAKAVYNKISSRFDACCFISNVREVAKQSSGLVSLQEQLLRDVFKDENVKVSSTSHGIGIIKQRIRSKKALIVLDDVDHESQFEALAGSLDWFCSGSRIIITSRDKQVLRAPRVNENNVYELEKLDDTQSLQLFNWYAFGLEQPVGDFVKISKEAAFTAVGLPLALTIFGSHFFDLKTVKEWRDMLERLKEDQDKEIHQRLRISFDSLDEKEKKVFLDIACFFIGEGREYATLMWESCNLFPDITIKVLIHKTLVSINDCTGEFEMHDHIRDMGRKIVEDERLSNPGMCSSRLWKDDETLKILQNKRGMRNIEAVQLGWKGTDLLIVDIDSFAAMSQLRMLQLRHGVTLEGEYKHFPKMLLWLQWTTPKHLDSLPNALHIENIVVLDLSWSSVTQVWDRQGSAAIKVLGKLKVLCLEGCRNLIICPDFTSMPHLQKLNFDDCVMMSELDRSIGHLKSLTHLSLRRCYSLEELPTEIWQLTSLEMLDLIGCSKITTLPSPSGDFESLMQPLLSKLKVFNVGMCHFLTTCPDFKAMPNLQKLDFGGCHAIIELHPSIGHLKSLTHLSLTLCNSLKELPQEFWQLASLEEFDLSYCYQITALPSQLGDSKSLKQQLLGELKVLSLSFCINLSICPNFMSMPHLQILVLRGCDKLSELHRSIGLLKRLIRLDLRDCHSLKKLPEEVWQLTSLEDLDLSGCSEITTLSSQLGDSRSLKQPLLDKLRVLSLFGCTNLTICPNFTSIPHLETLSFEGCEKMSKLHRSVGLLKRLTCLDLRDCHSLKELPQEVWQLTSLEKLDLKGCSQITTLSSQLGASRSSKQPLLDKLKVLNLDNCMSLATSLDFTSMPHLEALYFDGCEKMSELHPSIGHLKRLSHLSLKRCDSLKKLPEEIWQLTSLENLLLNYCTKLSTLPNSTIHLKQLTYLSLWGCSSLKEVPECVCSLLSLQVLEAAYCECIASLPKSFGNLRNLWELNLSWTGVEELPDSIVSLEKLHVLFVNDCKRLKFLPCFPPSLARLSAGGCYELEVISDVSNARGLEELNLSGCQKLVDIPGIEQLKGLTWLKLGGCRSLPSILRKRVQEADFQYLESFSIPGSLDGSSDARFLSFFLPQWFRTGSLILKLDECVLTEVVVHIDIISDNAKLLFQTSVHSRLLGRFGLYFKEPERDFPKVDLGEYEEVIMVASGGGCVGDDAQRRPIMMHVSVSGSLLLDGYLSSTTDTTKTRFDNRDIWVYFGGPNDSAARATALIVGFDSPCTKSRPT